METILHCLFQLRWKTHRGGCLICGTPDFSLNPSLTMAANAVDVNRFRGIGVIFKDMQHVHRHGILGPKGLLTPGSVLSAILIGGIVVLGDSLHLPLKPLAQKSEVGLECDKRSGNSRAMVTKEFFSRSVFSN
jgi:hypothetical protein